MIRNKVQVFSHFFTVTKPELELRKILYYIAGDYTVFGMVYDTHIKKKVWRPIKTFGFNVPKVDEFRFHIGQLEQVITAAQRAMVELDIERVPIYTPHEVDLKVNPKFVLRDDQEEAYRFLVQDDNIDFHTPLLSMPMGSGKSQPLSSMIRVPGGWKRMGNLKIGDLVHCPDGTSSIVCGIYPQGKKSTVRFYFGDGRSSESSYDHLWKVYLDDSEEGSVVTSREVIRLSNSGRRVFIDLPEPRPIASEESAYGNQGPSVFYDEEGFVISEDAVVDYVRSGGKVFTDPPSPNSDGYNGRLDNTWMLLFVYLENRELSNRDGGLFVREENSRDRDFLIDLVRSLGGFAEEVIGINYHHKSGIIVKNLPLTSVAPCFKKTGEALRVFKDVSRKIEFEWYRDVGLKEHQCISIEHPDHLYITDEYVVTHNTATSLVSVARIGQRFTVTVIAGYVEKWVNDILEVLILSDKDVMRVEGNKSLINYCHHVLDNQATPEKLPAATVISLNTIRSWQNAYLEDPNDPTLEVYGMKPWELHEKTGVGVNIFDEIHQHLHSVYRMFCFMHVPKTISLSATFTSQDQTELRIQRMMFPREKRFEEIKMRKYISVYACQYQIKDFKMSGIQTTARGSTNYSHVAFEASILAKADLKSQYIDMILRMANETFIKSRQHGDKCAIFVSSHAMAKEVCKAIVKKYPNLDTRTYLEYDPLENLMDSDIRVTTVLSGGTAHDIRGLTVSIQTISLNSIKSNLQVLGRLREIANRHCKFYYLYCASIPKQVEYHKNKIDIFKDWCKEHVDLMLDPIVPKINSAKSFASRFNPWS